MTFLLLRLLKRIFLCLWLIPQWQRPRWGTGGMLRSKINTGWEKDPGFPVSRSVVSHPFCYIGVWVVFIDRINYTQILGNNFELPKLQFTKPSFAPWAYKFPLQVYCFISKNRVTKISLFFKKSLVNIWSHMSLAN